MTYVQYKQLLQSFSMYVNTCTLNICMYVFAIPIILFQCCCINWDHLGDMMYCTNAYLPYVRLWSIFMPQNDLWCHPVWGPPHRVHGNAPVQLLHELLGTAKVNQLHQALRRYHNVGTFNIPATAKAADHTKACIHIRTYLRM